MTSTPYRLALLFITLVPIPFAFIDQPLIIIRTFTIVGSLFIPFLAATLLYLNNVRASGRERRADELVADERSCWCSRCCSLRPSARPRPGLLRLS